MLTRVDGDNNYLDYTKLDYRNERTTVAYLIDAVTKFSERAGGFFTFYFRDVNGETIIGRMFAVERFQGGSYSLAGLKRKPVKFVHTSQVFNGSPSLIITSIEPFSGEFDYQKFLGTVLGASQDEKYCNEHFREYLGEVYVPSSWSQESFIGICNARAGGLSKLSAVVVKALSQYRDTPGVNYEELVKAEYYTLLAYARYLAIVSSVEVPMKNQLLEIIYNSTANLDVRMKNIVADCCASVMEIGEPQHLYSHLIYNTLINSKRLLNFSFEFPTIMEGSTKRVGDYKLSRY